MCNHKSPLPRPKPSPGCLSCCPLPYSMHLFLGAKGKKSLVQCMSLSSHTPISDSFGRLLCFYIIKGMGLPLHSVYFPISCAPIILSSFPSIFLLLLSPFPLPSLPSRLLLSPLSTGVFLGLRQGFFLVVSLVKTIHSIFSPAGVSNDVVFIHTLPQ